MQGTTRVGEMSKGWKVVMSLDGVEGGGDDGGGLRYLGSGAPKYGS